MEPPPAPGPDDLAVEVTDGRVRVAGPVDLTTVGRLRPALLAARRDGAAGLMVDLSGVTHLAAAGVHLLHELAAQDPGLRLVAGQETEARRTLTLTGLNKLVIER